MNVPSRSANHASPHQSRDPTRDGERDLGSRILVDRIYDMNRPMETAIRARRRSAWAESHPLLREYHDHECGVRPANDAGLLELLCLERLRS